MDEPVEGETLAAASGLGREESSDVFSVHLKARLEDFVWRYVARRFPATARVLHLGCGGGELSEKLVRSGFAVTVADRTAEHVASCRVRLAPLRGWRAIQADGLSVPCDDSEFDLAICLDLFARHGEPERALREMRRVLKPGGGLLLGVRNAWAPRFWDLEQLAGLPLLLGRKAAQSLKGRLHEAGAGGAPEAERTSAASPWLADGAAQDPLKLIRGLAVHGYRLADIDGLGYGPLMRGTRPVLSDAAAIRVSDRLDWIHHATGLIWLARWLASENLYLLRRSL